MWFSLFHVPSPPIKQANSGNVDIVQPAGAATDEGDVQIKLLSMRKHRDDLQAFRAPSLQVA